MNQNKLKTVIREFLSSDKGSPVIENKYTEVFLEKRQEYINNLLKNKQQLVKRYGKDAEKVLTGRAVKSAKKHIENMKQQDIKELVRKSLMKESPDSEIKPSLQDMIKSSEYDINDFEISSNNPNKVELRYQYYSRLPEDLRSSLEEKFDVVENELEDEDTLPQYTYVISSKIEETIDSKKYIAEREENPEDKITMDVPLFIRMLEYAREDASNDVDLHDVAKKAIGLSSEDKTLTMDDYESIVGETESLDEDYKPSHKRYNVIDKTSGEIIDKDLPKDIALKLASKKKGWVISPIDSLAEDLDLGHQDNEPHMIKGELYRIGKYAIELYQMVGKFEGKGEVDFPAWWQSKITTSMNNMVSAKHYLDFETKEPTIDNMVSVSSDEEVINEKKAKKDYDGDGKIESSREEYKGVKDKAIKNAKGLAEIIAKKLKNK
jgi:hypothetical protein